MRECPQSLSVDQIVNRPAELRGRIRTPVGLRDHAILQLLATYGLRSSEIRNLRIEDIDWRAESIRIRHTARACSFLPLMTPVGWRWCSPICVRAGRPATDAKEIFIRTRAPYRKLGMLANAARRRLRDAGVKPPGQERTRIAFRHAARGGNAARRRATKGHWRLCSGIAQPRSTAAPYLKLATEDLRAIALDVPGTEVLS